MVTREGEKGWGVYGEDQRGRGKVVVFSEQTGMCQREFCCRSVSELGANESCLRIGVT